MRAAGIHSFSEWYALPDSDKEQWEAFVLWRERQLDAMQAALDRRVNDGKSVELTAYVDLMIARL